METSAGKSLTTITQSMEYCQIRVITVTGTTSMETTRSTDIVSSVTYMDTDATTVGRAIVQQGKGGYIFLLQIKSILLAREYLRETHACT